MNQAQDSQNQLVSLFLYLGLTFLISWGSWIPMAVFEIDSFLFYIGAFGPTLAALITTYARTGFSGIKTLLKRLTIWKVHIGWYLFSLFSTAPLVLLSIWLHVWLGGEKPVFNDLSQIYLVIPAFFYVLFTSVLGEEIGWRGFALPRLLQKVSPLTASLILALVWAIWHLPLFWMPGNFHTEVPIAAFLLQIVPFSIAYTWMYMNTQGSLLLPHLFHAASNTTLGVLPILPMDTGGAVRPTWIAVGLWSLVILGILLWKGPSLQHQGRPESGSNA